MSKIMNKDNLINGQLFLITVENNSTPLLLRDDIILIYSEKEKADAAAYKFRQLHKTDTISASLIDNNTVFFAKMVACRFYKFLFDGDGKILKFTDFCNVKYTAKTEDSATEIKNAQPGKKTEDVQNQDQAKPSIIEAFKRLPKIHRNRLISAYTLGLLSVASSMVLKHFAKIDDAPKWVAICPLIILLSLIGGLTDASKAADKVKEKNPLMAKAAKISMLLPLAAIIIFILMLFEI